MMQLINIVSAKHSRVPGRLELVIFADIGEGVQQYPYTYEPSEDFGLNPNITAWLMSNPDFPIGKADPPRPPRPAPTPAEKLARTGLSVEELRALLGL